MLAVVFLLCSGAVTAAAANGSTTDITADDLEESRNIISYSEYLSQNSNTPLATGDPIIYDAFANFKYVIKGEQVHPYLADERVAGKYYEFTITAGMEKNELIGMAEEITAIVNAEIAKLNADKATGKIADVDSADILAKLPRVMDVMSESEWTGDPKYAKSFLAYDGKASLYTPSTGTATWTLDLDTTKMYILVLECYPVANKAASIERKFYINGKIPFAEARYVTISKIWRNSYESGSFTVPKKEDPDTYLAKATQLGIKAEKIVDENTDIVTIKYEMPDYWTKDISEYIDDVAVRFFKEDIDRNEIRSGLVQDPEWITYTIKDSNGFMQEPFQFAIGPDQYAVEPTTTISLESVNEPLAIRSIQLVPYVPMETYEQYLSKYEGVASGTDKIKIEAEYYSAASSQTIYPVSDTTSAITSPTATDRTVLNTVGGDKWQSAGQWIEYKFKVSESGMYSIATRFKQNVLDGMYTSRALYIYSDDTLSGSDKGYYNGIPFAEAGRLQFNYASDWQSGKLTDGKDTFKIYFEAGVEYTIRFEVTLGNMGDVVNRVQKSLNEINNAYLNILKLTGTTPDEYRDYGFSRVMPDTMISMIKQARELDAVSQELQAAASVKSSMTATLDKIVRLLNEMGKDDDAVAKNLEQLKTQIGSLGTWVGNAKTQPLVLDYIVIQGADDESLPKANPNIFQALWYEITCFVQSFFRNYNRMGSMTEISEEESVEVWLAYGRDQSQVIRGLINSDFTPYAEEKGGVPIDLKLVAASTLLPSILSGMGPDVYIGVAQGTVINYAIRGALLPMDVQLNPDGTIIRDADGQPLPRKDFESVASDFNDAAMLVLGIDDALGEHHYYGLPETQNFTMMFIREDIFAELGKAPPQTWDEVKAIIPLLQSNNMQIGMTKDENIFLYQLGGDLFADNGMRINLDSNVALEAFNTMCEMFTMYSFPYKYDFPNRFRTGEMPIGFASYTDTYNKLKVFATEIEGLWGFYPLPGYKDENGNINNSSVSTITAICIITDCKNIEGAWSFSKWHAGAECQIDYSNEMVAILGPSAKHATANTKALESLPWTAKEYTELQKQFNNLAAIPNYPGRYIVERYTQFAFLAAYDDNMDPVDEMQRYITTINVEITRKRAEFGLETLEEGQTLAEKRMEEAEAAIKAAMADPRFNAEKYTATCNDALKLLAGYETEDHASLKNRAEALLELDPELFKTAAKKMNEAANSLIEYERYK